MRRFVAFLKAVRGFLAALFRPHLPVVNYSENGHSILEGWNKAPEEELIGLARAYENQASQRRKLGLFCYEGPHRGELFFLENSLETLGRGYLNSKVVSPGQGSEDRHYQLLLNGTSVLMADTGGVFTLNGIAEQKATLIDYDELRLLGNQFLVMDLSNVAQEECES